MLTSKDIEKALGVLEPLQKEAQTYHYIRLANSYSEVISHLKSSLEKLDHGISIFP